MEARTPPTTIAALAARVSSVAETDERVLFVYLFGSFARGDAREGSDVDLAVGVSGDFSLLDDASLSDRLAEAIGRDVDMVLLNRAPLWLQFRILGEGVVLFSRDETARVAFRAHVEKAFLDFRPYHDAYLSAVRDRARRGVLSGG